MDFLRKIFVFCLFVAYSEIWKVLFCPLFSSPLLLLPHLRLQKILMDYFLPLLHFRTLVTGRKLDFTIRIKRYNKSIKMGENHQKSRICQMHLADSSLCINNAVFNFHFTCFTFKKVPKEQEDNLISSHSLSYIINKLSERF